MTCSMHNHRLPLRYPCTEPPRTQTNALASITCCTQQLSTDSGSHFSTSYRRKQSWDDRISCPYSRCYSFFFFFEDVPSILLLSDTCSLTPEGWQAWWAHREYKIIDRVHCSDASWPWATCALKSSSVCEFAASRISKVLESEVFPPLPIPQVFQDAGTRVHVGITKIHCALKISVSGFFL